MQKIITTYVEKAYSELESFIKLHPECELKDFYYEGDHTPDYDNIIHCHQYILKYFPAYLAEYYYIYDYLNYYNLFQYNSEINILSFGCGSGVDLLSFYLRRNKILDFNYTGIDLNDWFDYRNLILNNKEKVKFIKTDIKDFSFESYENTNIIMFPKSICEFPTDAFDSFIDNLKTCNFISKRIAILISCRNRGFIHDQEKYSRVINTIKEKGYELVEEYLPIQEVGDMGIWNKVSNFKYPDDTLVKLADLFNICKAKHNCNDTCALGMKPMLRTKDWSFSFNILEKKL